MCLAIPGQVVAIEEADSVRMAKVDFGGVGRRVCLEYTPEVEIGDYVLVHVGFAISRIDEAEAARTFEYLERIGELNELEQAETG